MLFILEYRGTRPLSSWKEHRHLSCMSCLHCTSLFSELEVHLLFQNVLISWSSFGCKSSNTHPHSHCQLMFVTWHSCLHHTFLRDLFMFWQTLRTFYKTLETVSCNSTSMWIFFPLKSRSVPAHKTRSSRYGYPAFNLPGSWSPYQLLHVVLTVVVIQKFPGSKGGMSSERLIPTPAALHGGLSNLVYRLAAEV